jgi:hypothetical protein
MPCKPRPPSRNWKLLDLVDGTRCQPGQEVQVRLHGIPITDTMGRFAHIRGLYFGAIAQLDIDPQTSPSVSAYQLRSLFQNIFLRDVTGHPYWDNLDARMLTDDVWFRHWSMVNTPYLHSGVQGGPLFPAIDTDYGIVQPGADDPSFVDIGTYAPLTTIGGRNPLEGLLPLASVARAGADALRYRVAQSIAGAPLNVNFVGLLQPSNSQTAGMEVWADVVYLPELIVDAPWTLQNYTLSELKGSLNRPDAMTEYAWIRYFPDDTFQATPPLAGNGQTIVDLYDQVTVNVAGFNVMSGEPLARVKERMAYFYMQAINGGLAENNPTRDLPLFVQDAGDDFAAALCLLPYLGRQPAAAAGPVLYEYGSRGGATQTRYAHRYVGCHRTKEQAAQMADAAMCDPCAVTGTNGKGGESAAVQACEPMVMHPRRRYLSQHIGA